MQMHLQARERATSPMMAHHHHILDFSSSSPAAHHNTVTMAMAFADHHDSTRADTTPWPQPPQVSMISLYDTSGSGSSSSLIGSQHELRPFTAASVLSMQQPPCFRLESSRYLGPVKELLREVCSLGGVDLDSAAMNGCVRTQAPKWDGIVMEASSPACSPWGANPSVSSMDYMALERRKARLLSMVEEVDKCYRLYHEQMRATEMSFEAMAGTGAAQVYTKPAMCAMSRHFRCLRDALVGQIRALKKSMRESKDTGSVSAVPGASRGETPRLRALDQCLRKHRMFQQSGSVATVESYPCRSRRVLPERAVAVLRSWLFEHFLHPYPNDVDKHILVRQSGLSRSQISNWFVNARVRLWKPMIEDMYAEETKEHDGGASAGGGKPATDHHSNEAAWTMATTGDQSGRHLGGRNNTSACFVPSSIIADGGGQFLHGYPSLRDDGGDAVSVTMGLQQQQQSLRAMIMQQQSSLMIGAEEEDAVLPYRNLMGSGLLHDLRV